MVSSPKLSRIVLVDSLRGFALAGVALVHFTQRYITYATPQGFLDGLDSLPDYIVNGFVQFFFVGKSYALFSILFGLSFSIQMQSAEYRGENFSLRFLWRAALLFIIGYGHHLFYGGDILMIYALLAPFIIPFYVIKNRWIIIASSIIFIGLPSLITSAIVGTHDLFGLPSMDDASHPINMEIFHAFHSGSLSDVFRINTIYGMKMQFSFQLISGRLYCTYGYFLMGLLLGKIGLFRNIDLYTKNLKNSIKWASVSIPIILGVAIVIFMIVPKTNHVYSSWSQIIVMNIFNLINIPFSIIILCGFILLYQKNSFQKYLSFFAPYGRMALTNYVMQAIVGTFILYGWGLGLCDQIRTLYLFFISIGLVVVQTYICKMWLDNFKYGPLEWLWRCGTYLKIQTIIKESKTKPDEMN